jgi:hypothetical protein
LGNQYGVGVGNVVGDWLGVGENLSAANWLSFMLAKEYQAEVGQDGILSHNKRCAFFQPT